MEAFHSIFSSLAFICGKAETQSQLPNVRLYKMGPFWGERHSESQIHKELKGE